MTEGPAIRDEDRPEGENEEAGNTNDTANEESSPAPKNLFDELVYCITSFHAVVIPVSITMILSALVVVYINTEETRAQGEAAFSQSYEVFALQEGNTGQNFAASLGNVLIMVSVICVMTFVIVILYKYGCMKIFLGYMIVVTAMLLGYFTSSIALVALTKYGIRFDKFSFAYLIWNYAVVGVLAIFYNKGIPKVVTQGYLVGSSVVLAWQLSFFNDWTAWTLLVMLALYDLFAVLSPYGPLRKLTQLMSRPGARALPGLLYEATLPSGVNRPHRNQNTGNRRGDEAIQTGTEGSNPSTSQETGRNNETEQLSTSTPAVGSEIPPLSAPSQESLPSDENVDQSYFTETSSRRMPQLAERQATEATIQSGQQSSPEPPLLPGNNEHVAASRSPPLHEIPESRCGKVALAICKLYKLPIVDEEGVLRRRRQREYQLEYTAQQVQETEWTPQQLRAEVTAIFPRRGGRIVAVEQRSGEGKRYAVYNHSGTLMRTFVVNRQGKILQVVRRETSGTSDDNNDSIKLGLGDFIFYSVLVSKAAMQSYTAFLSCMLTILAGLGGTLVLLAVHGKALPALPISIFLAVFVFVVTKYCTEAYISEMNRHLIYV